MQNPEHVELGVAIAQTDQTEVRKVDITVLAYLLDACHLYIYIYIYIHTSMRALVRMPMNVSACTYNAICVQSEYTLMISNPMYAPS